MTTAIDSPTEAFEQLLTASIVSWEAIERLPEETQTMLMQTAQPDALAKLLQELGLLSEYQAQRVALGKTHELVFGRYGAIERLKTNGTTTVYRGEHLYSHQPVVIKVMSHFEHQNANVRQRFVNEMRVVSELRHPNIVAALDNGEVAGPGGRSHVRYFVMEYVPGCNLEEYVQQRGPLPMRQACEIALQLSDALSEADRLQLVHRDLMPSNVRITPEGQAKLLDFGLAHARGSELTEPGTVLGNLAYMAPEQAQDSGSVDIRADIFSLGATLFWCLTAQPPFPPKKTIAQQVISRRIEPAPSVCSLRADAPSELAAAIARMMALRKDDRFKSPQAVKIALSPFTNTPTTKAL